MKLELVRGQASHMIVKGPKKMKLQIIDSQGEKKVHGRGDEAEHILAALGEV
jgi:hypothetical protein